MDDFNKILSKDWRMTHLYKIADKNAQLITFPENTFQQQIRKSKARRKLVLKSRQLGITTGCVLDLFDHAIFTPHSNTAILAHKKQDLPKIFEIVRRAHKNMDPWIQPRLDKGGGSKYEMKFPEIGSKIYVDIEIRGEAIHRLHVSEAAFCDPMRLKASLGAVPPTSTVTFETTPNGMGNDFYRRWITKSPTTDKFFFPWFIQPEYVLDASHIKGLTSDEKDFMKKVKKEWGIVISKEQIAWRRAQQDELKAEFFQEFAEDDTSCFLASGGNPFDLELISRLLREAPEPIEDDGLVKVWEHYDKTDRYVIGADVAQGVRSDYSVADVFSVRTKKQVAQLRSNNLKPFAFADEVFKLAKRYWKGGAYHPLVAVELNNHGHAVNGRLYENGYPNLFYHNDQVPGWLTNSVTRPKMLDTFIEAVESGTILLNSAETLGECLTLVDNGGKIEAEDGEHDDTVISGAIATQMLIEDSVNDVYENLAQKIIM